MKRNSRFGAVAILLVVAACSTGCRFGREFRDVAGPSIHSGVSLILNGVVDGAFAAFEPDTTTGGS